MTEILVGLDDGPAAAAALRWAAAHSRITGLPLRAVWAWQRTALDLAAVSGDFAETAGADARARATRRVLDTLGDAEDVRWSLDIVEGSPGPVLVDRAQNAGLLVLGTGEHTGLRRAVLGSVSHYCLSHATTPVVAVPAPREPREADERRAHPALVAGPGPLL
jgi:nucleotide-binding universal stress UspA family protein